MHDSLVRRAKAAIPLDAVRPQQLKGWLARHEGHDAKWLRETNFTAKAGELRPVPSRSGAISLAVLGLGDERDPLALATFSESLPEGIYAIRDVPGECSGAGAVVAWLLGTYAFDRYRKRTKRAVMLVIPADVDVTDAGRIAEGVFIARDLINTPSNDMGPSELSDAAAGLARKHGA